MVFDGDVAVAWCQYGSPDELPSIYHRKEYEAGRVDKAPDYRLTCFFVDRSYRRRGVAAVALRGALDLIAKAGGGAVEAYPGHAGQEDFGLIPLQRHAQPLREGRLQLRAVQGKEPLRHAQDGLTLRRARESSVDRYSRWERRGAGPS
jgi:GNAT superfamily N-acetyltransferase